MQKMSPDTRSNERFSCHANAETSALHMMAEGGRGERKTRRTAAAVPERIGSRSGGIGHGCGSNTDGNHRSRGNIKTISMLLFVTSSIKQDIGM
jgi:hypothetical protein